MDKGNNCFSESNFDRVHKFIATQISCADTIYYLYGGYQIYLISPAQLRLKKDNYTLAVIDREKAIFSLAIKQGNSDALVKEAGRIFCEILLLTEREL